MGFMGLIIVSVTFTVGCGVNTRPQRKGIKPSHVAETMIKARFIFLCYERIPSLSGEKMLIIPV